MVTYRFRYPELMVRLRALHPVFLVLLILVSIVPAAAWDSESFVADEDPALYEEISEPVSFYSAAPFALDGSSASSVSGSDLVSLLSLDSSFSSFFRAYRAAAGITVPYLDWQPPSSASMSNFSNSSYRYFRYLNQHFTLPDTFYDPSFSSPVFGTNNVDVYSSFCWFDFDISQFGSFDSFSLDGSFTGYAYSVLGSTYCDSYPLSIVIEVNNSVFRVVTSAGSSSPIDLGGFVYSGSPVSSIRFGLEFPNVWRSINKDLASSSLAVAVRIPVNPDLTFSVLSDSSALVGHIDQAQDNLNQISGIESEFTGSMTSNFNALHMQDFSFPVAFVSAFALLSGLFSDVWLALGDYRVVYVAPLMLGIALLLLGRISRFAGYHSSRKGDSDA